MKMPLIEPQMRESVRCKKLANVRCLMFYDAERSRSRLLFYGKQGRENVDSSETR